MGNNNPWAEIRKTLKPKTTKKPNNTVPGVSSDYLKRKQEYEKSKIINQQAMENQNKLVNMIKTNPLAITPPSDIIEAGKMNYMKTPTNAINLAKTGKLPEVVERVREFEKKQEKPDPYKDVDSRVRQNRLKYYKDREEPYMDVQQRLNIPQENEVLGFIRNIDTPIQEQLRVSKLLNFLKVDPNEFQRFSGQSLVSPRTKSTPEIIKAIDENNQLTDPEKEPLTYLKDIALGLGKSVTGGLKGVAGFDSMRPTSGFYANPKDHPLFKLGEMGDNLLSNLETTDVKRTFGRDMAEGLGSFLSFLIPGYVGAKIGLNPTAISMVTGILANGGPEFAQTLEATNGDVEKAYISLLINGGMGITEALPIGNLLKRVDETTGGNLSSKMIKNGIKGFFEEGIQEAGQQLTSGFTEKYLYNPDKTVSAILDESLYAGLIGGLLGSGANVVGSGSEYFLDKKQDKKVLKNVRQAMDNLNIYLSEDITDAELIDRVNSIISKKPAETVDKLKNEKLTNMLNPEVKPPAVESEDIEGLDQAADDLGIKPIGKPKTTEQPTQPIKDGIQDNGFIKEEGFREIVYNKNGKQVGRVEILENEDGTFTAENIKVDPKYRRKGIATELMDYAKQNYKLKDSILKTSDGQKFTESTKPKTVAEEKQPWEMTQKEWFDYKFNKFSKKVQKSIKNGDSGFASLDEIKEQTDNEHKGNIERALKDGETVPQNILQDYPDLMSKKPAKIDTKNKRVDDIEASKEPGGPNPEQTIEADKTSDDIGNKKPGDSWKGYYKILGNFSTIEEADSERKKHDEAYVSAYENGIHKKGFALYGVKDMQEMTPDEFRSYRKEVHGDSDEVIDERWMPMYNETKSLVKQDQTEKEEWLPTAEKTAKIKQPKEKKRRDASISSYEKYAKDYPAANETEQVSEYKKYIATLKKKGKIKKIDVDEALATIPKKPKKEKPKSVKAKAEKPQPTLIGKNTEGNEVYEDSNGVRSYVEGNVRVSESVSITPSGYSVNENNREPRFKTAEEIATEKKSKIEQKIDDVDQDILDLGKKLLNLTGKKLTSGLDPEALLVSTQLIGKYIQKGIYKFQLILKDIHDKFKEDNFKQLFNSLKIGYNAFKTSAEDEIADQMDDFAVVKKYDLDQALQEINAPVETPQWKKEYDDLPESERKLVDEHFENKNSEIAIGYAPDVYLSGGLPGAGKSTAKKQVSFTKGLENYVLIDSDEIKAHLPGTAEESHERSSELAALVLDKSIDEGYNIVYDSQLTNYPKAKKLIEYALSNSGKAMIAFTDISLETSRVRSKSRLLAGESDRDIPDSAIIKGYNRAIATFKHIFDEYRGNPDVNFVMVNNDVDGRMPIIVFTQFDGITEIGDADLFANLEKISYIESGKDDDLRYEREDKANIETLKNKQDEIQARITQILISKGVEQPADTENDQEGEVSDEDEREDSGKLLPGDSDNTGSDEDSQGTLGDLSTDQGKKPKGPKSSGGKSGGSRKNDTGGISETEEDISGTESDGEISDNDGVGNGEGELDSSTRRNAARNYVIRKDSEIVDKSFSKIAKAEQNLQALRLLKLLENEKRNATADEQRILVKYVGWGGIPDIFDEAKTDWGKRRVQLKELLTEEDYKLARASTLNAHYTSPVVIRNMWEGIKKLGFKGGRILEPSMGTGHFFGLLPKELRTSSKLYGIELDSVTGRIAKKLYPNARIDVKGFQDVTRYPDGYFDLIISNIPFGDYPITDSKYPKNLRSRIHNYFFVRSLDMVKEGGIVAFVTSKGVLDSKSDEIRDYLNTKAELLGAVRLPNTAFKQNANTEVTTDILFFKKRNADEEYSKWNYDFRHLRYYDLGEDDYEGTYINNYFIENRKFMLGEMKRGEGLYSKTDVGLVYNGKDFAGDLEMAVKDALPSNVYENKKNPIPEVRRQKESEEYAEDSIVDGAYLIRNDEIYRKVNGQIVKQNIKDGVQSDKIIRQVKLNEYARRILAQQMADADDSLFQDDLKALNREYDQYVKKYGFLNHKSNRNVLKSKDYGDDPNRPFILSLENYDDDSGEATKSDRFSKRTVFPVKEIGKVDSVKDALVISLNTKGKIDIDEIHNLTDIPHESIIDQLKADGRIYYSKGEWQAADEYLSGNVRKKLREAELELEETKNEELKRNIEALKQVLPKDLSSSDISVSIGASWVPASDYLQFLSDILEIDLMDENYKITYVKPLNRWTVKGFSYRLSNNAKNTKEYGTDFYDAIKLFEDALNNGIPKVYDRLPDGSNKINVEKTQYAQEKQQKIKDKFKTWIFSDQERKERLTKKYNEEYNNIRLREYNGSHLVLPGLDPETAKRLFPHVKDAVWRIIQQRDVLLGHGVGFGKTWSMSIAAMELRRLGLAKKPVHVVKNHMIGQYAREFAMLYPDAKLLVITPEDFTQEKRNIFMSRIANGDWDSIIVAYTVYERLPLLPETMTKFITDQIKIMEDYIDELKNEGGQRMTVKQIEKAKKKLEEKLEEMTEKIPSDRTVKFEETGIDQLFVDEAHNFKNLFFPTKLSLPGLAKSSAGRAMDMYSKVQYIQNTYGKGVVFATGTPISNTMAELFTMQRYLQPTQLQEYGLEHFDNWVNDFGEVATKYELNILGTGIRMRTRLASFKNIPEIMSLFRLNADIKTKNEIKLNIPEIKGGKPAIITAPGSDLLKKYVDTLAKRYEDVMSGRVEPHVDNPLKITNDGRKAAVDLRLVGIDVDYPNSKINLAVANMYDIWEKTKAERSTQIGFLDMGIPGTKQGINLYKDIKDKLVARGVPADEIAFIHTANNDEKKMKLFEDMNTGRKRILLGSTAKLGEGTNIQKKLVAEHRIDAPWRPSDIEQGDGRILRSGNENKEVWILRYVTEGSFDSYIWQLLENKIRFITQAMSNDLTVRSAEDIEGRALTYAEVKAIATGNPMILERFKVEDELMRLNNLRGEHLRSIDSAQWDISHLPSEVTRLETRIKTLEAVRTDIPEEFAVTIGKTAFDKMTDAGNEVLKLTENIKKEGKVKIGKYLGFDLIVETMSSMRLNPVTDKFEPRLDHTLYIEQKEVNLLVDPIFKDSDAKGIMVKVRNTVSRIDNLMTTAKNNLDDTNKRIVELKKLIQEPFEKEARFQELQKRLKEIEEKLDINKSDAGISSESADIAEQRESEGGIAGIDYVNAVVKKLNKGQLRTRVEVYNDQEIKETLKNISGSTVIETPLGFTHDGIVYINSDKASYDTPIHEFGHLWVSWVKDNKPGLWSDGINMVKRSPILLEEVKELYPNLEGNALYEEALATAIGQEGGELTGKPLEKFKFWLSKLWTRLKQVLGMADKKLNIDNINMNTASLEDFARAIAKDLLTDRQLTSSDEEIPGLDDAISEFGLEAIAYQNNSPKNENFKKWFGESKIVDENGNPEIAVHYTKFDFTTFDMDIQDKKKMFKGFDDADRGYTRPGADWKYFVMSKGFFFFVGKNIPNPTIGNAKKMEVFLKIENPLDFRKGITGEEVAKLIPYMKEISVKPPSPGEAGTYFRATSIGGVKNGKKNGITGKQLYDWILENNYHGGFRYQVVEKICSLLNKDGIIFEGNQSGTINYETYPRYNERNDYVIAVAFKPNQIKSIDNSGSFDAENPDIMFQRDRIPKSKVKARKNKTISDKTFQSLLDRLGRIGAKVINDNGNKKAGNQGFDAKDFKKVVNEIFINAENPFVLTDEQGDKLFEESTKLLSSIEKAKVLKEREYQKRTENVFGKVADAFEGKTPYEKIMDVAGTVYKGVTLEPIDKLWEKFIGKPLYDKASAGLDKVKFINKVFDQFANVPDKETFRKLWYEMNHSVSRYRELAKEIGDNLFYRNLKTKEKFTFVEQRKLEQLIRGGSTAGESIIIKPNKENNLESTLIINANDLKERANQVKKLMVEMKKLGELYEVLPVETYNTKLPRKRIHELLTEKAEFYRELGKYEADLKAGDMKAAGKIKAIQEKIDFNDRKVKNSFKRGQEGYFKRAYLSKEQEKTLKKYGYVKPTRLDLTSAMYREDIPLKVRVAMGEILTAAYPTAKAIVLEGKDISIGRFFEAISEKPEWASESSVAGWVHIEPSKKKFGKLKGKWVEPEVYKQLDEILKLTSDDYADKFFKKLTAIWKASKTTQNPPTVFRNFYTAVVMLDMYGTSPADIMRLLPRAIRELKGKGDYKEEIGRFKGSLFTTQELQKFLEVFDDYDSGAVTQKFSELSFPDQFLKVFGKITLVDTKFGKGARWLYQGNDMLFKTIKLLHEVEKGSSLDTAYNEANKVMYDYGDVPKWVRNWRENLLGMPFVTWSYKTIPRVIEASVKRPIAFWKYPVIFYALTQYALSAFGIDDDEWEQILEDMPDRMKMMQWLVLPFRDENGKLQLFDLTFIMPYSDIYQIALSAYTMITEGETPSGATIIEGLGNLLQNPVFQVITELSMNYNRYTRREIWSDADSAAEKYMKMADYTYKLFMPSFFPEIPFTDIRGGYVYDKLRSAITGRPDYYGRVFSINSAVTSAIFGLKTNPLDPNKNIDDRIKSMESDILDLQKKKGSILKDDSITMDKRMQKAKELDDQVNEIKAKIKDYEERQVPTSFEGMLLDKYIRGLEYQKAQLPEDKRDNLQAEINKLKIDLDILRQEKYAPGQEGIDDVKKRVLKSFDYKKLMQSIKTDIEKGIDSKDMSKVDSGKTLLDEMLKRSEIPKDVRKKAEVLQKNYDKYVKMRENVDRLNRVFSEAGVTQSNGKAYNYKLSNLEEEQYKVDLSRAIRIIEGGYAPPHYVTNEKTGALEFVQGRNVSGQLKQLQESLNKKEITPEEYKKREKSLKNALNELKKMKL